MDGAKKASIFCWGLLGGSIINIIIGTVRTPQVVVERHSVLVPVMTKDCRMAVDQMRLFLDAENNKQSK